MAIRILIVDDHAVVRTGLRTLLSAEPGFEIVGEAADGYGALKLAQDLCPDVILLDVNMPNLNGIEAAKQLAECAPAARVLILTLYEDVTFLRQAIEHGAAGYILKSAVEPEIINAIRAVMNGNLYVDPAMTITLVRNMAIPKPTPRDPPVLLSTREVEILRRIARGNTNREIADELHISVRTVEGHRASLLNKLGLSTPIQIVRYAMQHNLLEE